MTLDEKLRKYAKATHANPDFINASRLNFFYNEFIGVSRWEPTLVLKEGQDYVVIE